MVDSVGRELYVDNPETDNADGWPVHGEDVAVKAGDKVRARTGRAGAACRGGEVRGDLARHIACRDRLRCRESAVEAPSRRRDYGGSLVGRPQGAATRTLEP